MLYKGGVNFMISRPRTE